MQSRTSTSLKALLAAAGMAVLLSSAAANAASRYHGHPGYAKHGYGVHYGTVHHHYHHRGQHRHRGYHRGYRHKSNDAAFLLGGIVIGSILTHALTPPPVYAAPPRVVRYDTHVVGRRLFRDIHGNCFERRTDETGSELLIELPASECAW